MKVSLLACLIFLFLLPNFISGSCPPALPCNKSIQIIYPFNFQPDNNTIDSSCRGLLAIGCHSERPVLYWRELAQLESISYNTNTIRILNQNLSNSLKESGCDNLYFNFSAPIRNFFYGMYDPLYNSLSSLRCHPPNQRQSPPEIFGNNYSYNLSYSPSLNEGDRPQQDCSRPDNSVPTFELMLIFRNNSPALSLQSASYSYNLAARPGCFTNSMEVFNCPEGCKDSGTNYSSRTSQARRNKILIGATLGLLTFFVGLILILMLRCGKSCSECILLSKCRPKKKIELLIEQYGSYAPKRYKYGEIKKITNSFQESLGKGGFGTVYKGKLPDGRLVAVKILRKSSSHGEEFLNEVLSIGRTSHVNVVSLLGFCIEGSKHALIYEYMPNGSLDNYIYCENPKAVLGWEKLYEIAISIARGLEYLHRGCNARIVHFDIKPQNILLDEDFNPKIADFGLAKLCPPKESILSMAEMRGTVGYIAPEVFSRSFGAVSTKSDVYSYGMMVLEMVGGRRNAKPSADNPSRVYFPHWLHDCLAEGNEIQACDGSIGNEEIAKKMGMVGLWCTQTIPGNRPTISRVIEMLEKGLDELELPPKPYSSSPPHFAMLSERISNS